MPMLSILRITIYPDTQEQIIIASPKQQQQQQRTEGSSQSQDSGLENSTPEVSPPGPQSRSHWRNESESSLGSFSSDKSSNLVVTSSSKPDFTTEEPMTQHRFISTKRSLAPSPPTETSAIQQFSSLTLETNPIECNASAKFICRKDYSEAAICKAVVAQGALEETSAKVKAIPMTIRAAQTGRYSSVRIEVEATRENHAKVAAIKSVSSKEHQKTSGNFKPMCELIDEDLQRRQVRSPCSLQSSVSPASSSKSSDFGADNRSLDRMSFGSGGHSYGNDYKVVALNAKPEPGKLTEFVPEVERNKPSEREEYTVSSYGVANGATRSPPLDAAVVRNWELSDEESPLSKSPVNNNNTEKQVTTTATTTTTKFVEPNDTTKYDYPHLDRKFIRSQGYPTPFKANSKNYVNADSKFHILPQTEERPRPKIVKKEHQQQLRRTVEPQLDVSETRRVHNSSRHPSGEPQPRKDLFSEEPKPLKEKSQSMLTVSGKLRCAHCTCELGRGSAMIIEALGLFYHINCFRCHVCDKMLGSGSQTTDVRVRDGKLHCEKCYSNEDLGVRLSEI